jgi:poly-gamma-glutamate synthesis protein (capsule biosynthesis protein)
LAAGACSTGDSGGGTDPAPAAEATQGTAPDAPTTVDRPLRSFTVLTTGDFLLHMPVQRKALAYGGGSTYDFSPMLAQVAGQIAAADLAICHLETPLSPDDTALSGYPIFNTAKEIADAAAAAGYDTCSTASNHSLDQGAKGVASTLDQLDRVGLGHAGTARSAEEAARPDRHEVNGVSVAHLDYTYGTNGIPVPAGQPFLVNLIDLDRILADAHAAKAAGAEVVIVEMHWGLEYQSLPTAEQQQQARVLSDSPDIDLVIGQHVHVVQAAERRGDEYVVYGTGNLLSNQGAPATPTASNDGVIVEVHFAEQPDGSWAQSVRYTPTYVDRSSYVIRRATPTDNPQSYQRTVAAMNGLGPGTFDGAPSP